MELCDCPCLVAVKVFQVKAPHKEIFTPDMLRDQIYLVSFKKKKHNTKLKKEKH